MIFDARNDLRGTLYNADTGEKIRHARWHDEATGEYEAWATDAAGNIIRPPRLIRGRCRLRFVVDEQATAMVRAARLQVGRSAGRVETPAEMKQLLADHRKGRPIIAIPGRECEIATCHALALWETTDEEAIEPQMGTDGRLYDRGMTVRIHRYCDRHYRNPLFTSRRGVVSEVAVQARPQW